MVRTRDQHYGWKVSPYTAKTRSYLRYVKHDFDDVEPNVWRLAREITKAVGRPIMPTVQLADGRWLQDSSVIIDHYSQNESLPKIHPNGYTQQLASYLLEVFADEWLPMAALQYRWGIPENTQFAMNEFARSGLPWMPRWIGRKVVSGFARKMQSYLPVLGVDESTKVAVEATVATTISALENQLSETAFILGGRPCLGDFALYGPLWAHLFRDPGSRYLFDDAPHVVSWMETLTMGASIKGEFLPGDLVPATLSPLFECVLRDQWSWIQTLGQAIDAYVQIHPKADRVPRALGDAEFSIRGISGRRKLATFVQWKAQRAADAYRQSAGVSDVWLRQVLGLPHDAEVGSIFETTATRFRLERYKMVIDRT